MTSSRARRAAAAVAVVAALGVAAGAPAQGPSVVRFPFPQEDGSLTPYTFALGYPLVTLVYDTLMWRDEDGVPRPWLARSVRRSPDGLTVTVRLRRGARWHDGRPVTAADVAFTLRYVAEHPHPRFTPQLRDVRAAEATGTHTVVLRLRRPSAGILDQPLADVPILPAHIWSRLPPGRLAPRGLPVGSGPYRLAHHARGALYRFEAVRDYFRGRPAPDRLELPVMRDADRVAAEFRAGRLDAAPVAGDARAFEGVDTRLLSGPSYTGVVLALNVAAPPLNRPAARRAVASALDLERIARATAGADEQAVQPADRGYLSPRSRWAPRARLHRFRPAAARVALAEQGLGEIRILVPADDQGAVQAGRQVALAVRRAGGRARVVRRPRRRYERALRQPRVPGGRPAPYEAAIVTTASLASYDPSFLRPLFGTRGELNVSGYASPAFDRAAEAVAQARSPGGRQAAVARALRLLARDLPVVPLFYGDVTFAVRPRVFAGWRFVRGSGILDKRSFVGRRAPAPPRPPAASADPVDRAPRDAPSLAPWLLGGAVALSAAALLALVSRRSRR